MGAMGFKDELERQKWSFEKLLQFIDVPKSTVNDWCAEKKRVPYTEQRITAAWLGIPFRSLFKDLHPTACAVDEEQA